MTRDQTPAHNTISLGKFAKRLASAVGRFMEVSYPLSLGIYIYRHKVQYFSKTNNFLFFFIGGPSTSLSRAKLADRRWRDHKRTSHLNWGRTRHAGQLAAHPPT